MSKLDEALKTNFPHERARMLTHVIFTRNWVMNRFHEFLKPYDLSVQQLNILRILKGAGDWKSMNDIKSLMIEKSPHTTRMATKLIDKELIERMRSEKDRRVVYLRLTQKGHELLAELNEGMVPLTSFLDNITDEEAKMVNDVLDKLSE